VAVGFRAAPAPQRRLALPFGALWAMHTHFSSHGAKAVGVGRLNR